MPNLREKMIRLAYTNPALRQHLLPMLKQATEFTLYKEYLAWREKLWEDESVDHPGKYMRMDVRKAVHSSEKTFTVLQNLWSKDMENAAKLHAWASRIRDPNVAVSMAYTAWRLQKGDINGFDAEYFFQNWKFKAVRFKTFGALVEKACEDRFWEIAGRDSREKPAAPPKSKFAPPPVPPNLIPTTADAWQLYDSPGAEKAARSLASAMKTILDMAGRNILPSNKDAVNAKKVAILQARMGKVLSTYREFGAMDSEPRGVFQSGLRRYLQLYLDMWDFPETFDA